MDIQQAIDIANRYVKENKFHLKNGPFAAIEGRDLLTLGKDKTGWRVLYKLDIPEGIEPDTMTVEVYDSGEIVVPYEL